MQHDFKRDLIRSYDRDATARAERELPDARIAFRDRFIGILRDEGRRRLIEFGAGAGQDAEQLLVAGLDVVGIDLSPGNVAQCRARGVDARVGDFYDLDFSDGAFEAAWAMSTLLHVPNDDIDRVLAEFVRVLTPGAPLGLGVWGGVDRESIDEDDWAEPPRFFAHRSDEHLREILERHGTIEVFDTAMHDEGGHYQWCVVRTPAW